MATKKQLSYGRQWISASDIDAVKKVLNSDFLTQGPSVPAFEKALADYCGAKYAVAVSSGTAALHIVYLALGLTNGDEVVTTPLTFAATANAALYCGARPVFVDIVYETGLIDTDVLERHITNAAKIIAPVHYAGLACDMKKISEIAKRHKMFVVEDACHALGSIRNGVKVGSCKYSDAAVLSFHPVKHITTGEGGAVLTNNKELYEKMLLLRSHGINRDNFVGTPSSPCYHEMQILGYNYRITDFQAALGMAQLKKVDKFIAKRRKIAQFYYSKLGKVKGLTLQTQPEGSDNSYHLFPVLFKNQDVRDAVYNKLLADGIRTQIHYIPVYAHPYYRKNGYAGISCRNADKFYSRTLSLPMYPKMTDADMKYTVKCLIKAVKG